MIWKMKPYIIIVYKHNQRPFFEEIGKGVYRK